MNYNRVLLDYIDKCCYDEPIFIEDIKKYFIMLKLLITKKL